MSIEQLIIERFVDTLRGSSSFRALFPDIDRTDGRPQTNQNRRCDLRVIRSSSQDVYLSDGTLTTAYEGALQLDLVLPRARAFGVADNPEHTGDMDTGEGLLTTLLDNQTLSISGYGLATISLESQGVGESSSQESRRYHIYRFSAMTGTGRRLTGADITVEAAGLGDRVILGFTESDDRQLLENTGWTDCSRSFVAGRSLRRVTLLVASTNAAPLDVASGTELSGVVITREASPTTVQLLVHSVRPVPVRAGSSALHFTELSCVVNG